MAVLLAELKTRWDQMFAALAAGSDVPPTQRLRAEGMMEAAVLVGLATTDELLAAMDASYTSAFGREIAADFAEDWQDFYPFPQIPAVGKRAPVYPSTPE
jgi:hypothetical protein